MELLNGFSVECTISEINLKRNTYVFYARFSVECRLRSLRRERIAVEKKKKVK